MIETTRLMETVLAPTDFGAAAAVSTEAEDVVLRPTSPSVVVSGAPACTTAIEVTVEAGTVIWLLFGAEVEEMDESL